MKKLFILLSFLLYILCFTSCSGDAYKARQSAEAECPGCKVYNVPGYRFSFIAVDSIGKMYWVSCNNLTNDDVSYKAPINP